MKNRGIDSVAVKGFAFQPKAKKRTAERGRRRTGSRAKVRSEHQTVAHPVLVSRASAAKALKMSRPMVDRVIAVGLVEARRLNNRLLVTSASIRKLLVSDPATIATVYKPRGGRRTPGEGKRIGRPPGSTNHLLRNAAVLASVPKTSTADLL